MLNTLQRYIFRRIALVSALTFVAVLAVVWSTQVLTRIDFTTISGDSIGVFLAAFALLTPQLIALLLPFALVIGLVQVFTAMNADSELAVVSAAGVSRGRIAWPVMVLAGFAALFILISNHAIEPRSGRALRDVLTALRGDLLASFLQEGVFTRIDRDLTIYVDHRLPGNGLGGIMVSDTRDEKASLIYYAQTGMVGKIGGNEVLLMTNGQVQNKRPQEGAISVIRFNAYAISLAQFSSAGDGISYNPQERETIDLLRPDPDERIAKTRPTLLRAEFHRRMTDWLYPFLFAFVGLAVAGQTRSHRQARAKAFVLAIGGALFYKGVGYGISGLNRSNGDYWWLFYAFPLAAIAFNATLYWRGIAIAVPDAVTRSIDGLAAAIQKMRIRHARARAT